MPGINAGEEAGAVVHEVGKRELAPPRVNGRMRGGDDFGIDGYYKPPEVGLADAPHVAAPGCKPVAAVDGNVGIGVAAYVAHEQELIVIDVNAALHGPGLHGPELLIERGEPLIADDDFGVVSREVAGAAVEDF